MLAKFYSLPDPIVILNDPPSKFSWKKIITNQVSSHWHQRYCDEVSHRSSLCSLRPAFLPLNGKPHPLWSSCQSSPTAVRAATIQARILTGRYHTDLLRSKWDGNDGTCRLPGCGTPEADSVHLLSGQCEALKPYLNASFQHNLQSLLDYPDLHSVTLSLIHGTPFSWVRYLLDPSCEKEVIQISQLKGEEYIWPLFKLSRSMVWTMHKYRLKMLGLETFV